jgi:hypothetical protein
LAQRGLIRSEADNETKKSRPNRCPDWREALPAFTTLKSSELP